MQSDKELIEALERDDTGRITSDYEPTSLEIEVARNAICREFGNNGTDGYYIRILKAVHAAARLRALTAEPEVKQVTWRRGDVAVAKMSTQDGLTEGKEYVVLAVNGEGDTVQIMDNDGRTNFRMAHYFTRLTAEPDDVSREFCAGDKVTLLGAGRIYTYSRLHPSIKGNSIVKCEDGDEMVFWTHNLRFSEPTTAEPDEAMVERVAKAIGENLPSPYAIDIVWRPTEDEPIFDLSEGSEDVRQEWLDCARAALSASPRRDGWQPIETAPKDGTRVICWNSEWQAPESGCLYGMLWAANSLAADKGGWKYQPTHWQPLPAAPQEDQR